MTSLPAKQLARQAVENKNARFSIIAVVRGMVNSKIFSETGQFVPKRDSQRKWRMQNEQ
jgi:hypothetical protein